jgi:hypothetical protein
MVPYQPPGPPQTYGYEKPQGNYNPPPPQHMAMVPQQPHQQQLQQQQQQAPQTVVVAPQDEKKSKFGKIGGQVGDSALNITVWLRSSSAMRRSTARDSVSALR